MSNLSDLRDGVVTRLNTIAGLRAYDYVPDRVELPAAIVTTDDTFVSFDLTLGGGARWALVIRLLVARATDRAAQKTLDDYIATTGTKSIRAAIDGDVTLDGAADTCRLVEGRRLGVYTVAGIEYTGAEYVLDVIAST